MQKECQIQSVKSMVVLHMLKEQVTMGPWNMGIFRVGQHLFKGLGTVNLNIYGYNPCKFQRNAQDWFCAWSYLFIHEDLK